MTENINYVSLGVYVKEIKRRKKLGLNHKVIYIQPARKRVCKKKNSDQIQVIREEINIEPTKLDISKKTMRWSDYCIEDSKPIVKPVEKQLSKKKKEKSKKKSVLLPIKNWPKIRREIIDRDYFCCRICHSEHNLHVHHIDYDRSNNSSLNLITLCQPCHKQLHDEGYKPDDNDYPAPWGDVEKWQI